MIVIDGAQGEGGGQILRSSVGLAAVTGQAVRIIHVRAGREKPGLRPQHLTAVLAAAAVGDAEVEGASVGSREVVFRPRRIVAGLHRFAIGTAGATTLVVQAVLPALLMADGPSTLIVEGGTHNTMAPPFDFLDRCFLPVLRRMGANVRARIERHGFYPRGGGRLVVEVEPVARLSTLALCERGPLLERRATALVAGLPRTIAERELATVASALDWPSSALDAIELEPRSGPGNAIMAEVSFDQVREMATAIGEKGRPAEQVAARAAGEMARYLASPAPVGEHLADQLLLPVALAGGGVFRTLPPTLHTRTQIEVVQRFLPVVIETRELGRDDWEITTRAASG